jgi:hypothetical protein
MLIRWRVARLSFMAIVLAGSSACGEMKRAKQAEQAEFERRKSQDTAPAPLATSAAENPVPSLPGGIRVMHRRFTSMSGRTLAKCAANEWLLGGGCEGLPRDVEHASYPETEVQLESHGGGWVCSFSGSGFTVTAHALCGKGPDTGAAGEGPQVLQAQ